MFVDQTLISEACFESFCSIVLFDCFYRSVCLVVPKIGLDSFKTEIYSPLSGSAFGVCDRSAT